MVAIVAIMVPTMVTVTISTIVVVTIVTVVVVAIVATVTIVSRCRESLGDSQHGDGYYSQDADKLEHGERWSLTGNRAENDREPL